MAARIIKDFDGKFLKRLQKTLAGVPKKVVHVGYPDNGEQKKGADISIAHLAAVHEFGASIDHPGGTRYVIRGGEAVFVSNSFVGPVHGVTEPHKINIPERSFIRTGIRNGQGEQVKLNRRNLKKIVHGQMTVDQGLGQLGLMAVKQVQKTIQDGDFTPLRPETIRRKKSSKPLQDTGQLRKGIHYEIPE